MITGCDSKDTPDPDGGMAGPSPRGFLHHSPTLVIEYNYISGFNEKPRSEDYRYCGLTVKTSPTRIYERGSIMLSGLPGEEDPDFPYDKSDLFEKLCILNGDTVFNATAPYYEMMYHDSGLQSCLIEYITDISLKAVTDYDSNHPEGSSLTEMASLTYSSLYPFIQEGYDFNERSTGNGYHPSAWEYQSEHMSGVDEEGVPYFIHFRDSYLGKDPRDGEFIFHCRAADVKKNPLKMVINSPVITFDSAPDRECRVEMTVTVQFPGGLYPARTYTCLFRVTP